MGDNNRGSYSGLVKPVPTITYGEASKINDAYKKLVQQGFKGTYADFRSGFSNKVDDILSGKFKFSTPQSRTQAEIQAAGGYQQYLRQKKQEALEQFERQKAEVQAYNNNPQEYIKSHSGLGVEEFQAPSIEQARLAYNNTMRYLNNLNPNGSVRTSRNTVVNKNVINRNTVNRNTDVNNNFNIKAFQNWVLQRNKFWKSRDYDNNVYSLGKSGVDGIMGKYTRNAYNALKNEYNKYLKSGMKNYSNFYNKYIYKDPTDLLERMNDEIEILNANAQVNDILDTTIPKVEFNPVEPYTHDEYVNNKLNIMRQYKTDPTPQENNHNVTENDMIGLQKTMIFKYGGGIPKYQNGSLFEKGMSYVSNAIRQARDSEFVEGADREVGQNITGNNVGRFILNRIANNLDPNSTLFGWRMPPGIRTILGSPVTLASLVPTINPSSIGLGILQYASDKLYEESNENQNKQQKSNIQTQNKPQTKSNYSQIQLRKLGGIIKASGGWRVADPSKGEKEGQIYGTVNGQTVTFGTDKSGYPVYFTWTTDNTGKKHFVPHRFKLTDRDIWELKKIEPSLIPNDIEQKDYYYGYVNNQSSPTVPLNASTQTPSASAKFDLSENNPLVQEFLKKNGYVKSTPTDASKNGNIVETIKPKPETTKPEEQKQVTYSDVLLQNTDTIKNRIFNSGWRGAFKDSLNRALMTPDYYNNGDGTQVFDFELPDGTIVNYDYLSGNGMLNRRGLLKAGAMRKLVKNFKQQGRNIAQQRYVGVGLNPIQTNQNTQIQLNPVNPVQIDNSVSLLGPEKINPGIDFINSLNSSNLTSNTSPRLEGSEDLPEWIQS